MPYFVFPKKRHGQATGSPWLHHSLLVVGLLLPAVTVLAASPAYYYDGDRKVIISPRTDLAADFGSGRRSALSASPQGTATPTALAGDSSVRIYRVTAGSAAAAAAPVVDASPVYTQGETSAGRLMALPGGVLVKFKPDWSRAQIYAWVAARGLTIGHALPIGTNWFRIDTAPGLTSLETANAIFETGEVLSASPNWWMQTRAK